jgi:hypothetical protein
VGRGRRRGPVCVHGGGGGGGGGTSHSASQYSPASGASQGVHFLSFVAPSFNRYLFLDS